MQHSTGNEAKETRRPVVLQILPNLNGGGVERGTIEMAAALKDAGWTPVVVSSGGRMVYELDRIDAVHVTLPVASKNPFVMRRNVRRLRKVIREYGVDIVHARSRAPAWSARAAARKEKVPFVTTFHAAYTRGGFLKNFYNAIMAKGDRVIAISNFIADHVRTHYKVPEDRLVTIPRGVDYHKFNPAAVSAERIIKMATDWALPDGVPVVMLPGRLTRLKGHVTLIEALARMKTREFLALFVGAGEGREAYRRELNDLIERHGLQGRVQIKDYCHDMSVAMMLADVVVSATLVPEGFGRVSVEAQAMGRPVVATAHGGSLETVLDRETGWLVPVDDPDAMAEALDEALGMSPEARQKVAARTRQFVIDHFTIEKMCARTLEVYRDVLAAKQDPYDQ
ncbi:glycosyltransferase family 4 protein [Sneathiella chinensis]|uniref:Glycosyl transferase n=1 Tax=Sneathiella chinensis TaxID=349750 RepID=A0ABQ5U1S6_9PROT|nr:glycosyltransferase family 4 protein [Sneathiella chinensis]GLQ05376.1 glycosyl transferase [Sneathiella chinensis]